MFAITFLVLAAAYLFGSPDGMGPSNAPRLPDGINEEEARQAARQLAEVAPMLVPAVRSGAQSSPIVRELQRRMGDRDPDGRLGPATRKRALEWGAVVP